MIVKKEAPYPYLGINGEYFDKEFLDSVWRHLQKSALMWQAGIAEPNPAEKFAYHVMKQITMRKPES